MPPHLGQDHPLEVAGGAARVDQDGRLVHGLLLQPLSQQAVVLGLADLGNRRLVSER